MTIEAERIASETESRTKRLKAATHAAHETLDRFVMRANPFRDRQSYGRFLRMQHALHRDLDALFFDEAMSRLLPDLQGRRRLDLVEQDLVDLGVAPVASVAPLFERGAALPRPKGLGWLYVIEGSNLGAAFLLKYAAALGFNEAHGARHLAGAPEGRGLHWKTFTAALDQVALTAEDEQQVIGEASAAFNHVQKLAKDCFPEIE